MTAKYTVYNMAIEAGACRIYWKEQTKKNLKQCTSDIMQKIN
jgi:hypothetical protein